MSHSPRGTHTLVDGTTPRVSLLNDGQQLSLLLRDAVERAGATVLEQCIKQFAPQGVTVVLVLAESHASIHTYPEYGAYMVDVFTCGDVAPESAAREFAAALGGEYTIRTIARGWQS